MGTDEDYLDSLLKAATNPEQDEKEESGSDNIYNSLLMDDNQLAEIDELLGLANDLDDVSSNDDDTDNGKSNDDDISDDDIGFDQLLDGLELTGEKEEPAVLDAGLFEDKEEESVFTNLESITEEEPAAQEETVPLQEEPAAQEEAVPLQEESAVNEENVPLQTEPAAEEESAALDVDPFFEATADGTEEIAGEEETGENLQQQIDNAMMDSSLSEEVEIDLNGTEDLGNLLDGFGDDEELAEINELLKKSQNNEFVDEDNDMLALLESTADEGAAETVKESANKSESDESGEEAPKKKKWGRKKKAEKADKDQPEGADTENKKASTGFFGKLFAALTEEEEEPEELIPSDEEGKAEEGTEPPSSKKKDKKAKKKKGKKGAETNEEILEEMDAEDAAAKKGKKKKPKKEKKPKKVKPEVIEEKGKKIPRKMIVRIFVLCFSIMIVIILPTMFLPQMFQKSEARSDFYEGNYQAAYEGLVGYDLSDSDEIILRKSELLSQLERKERSYEAYRLAGENEKALNALMEGVAYYQNNVTEITALGIQDDALVPYGKLLTLLQSEYSLGEAEVMEIIAMEKLDYTYRIKELAGNGETLQPDQDGALPEGEAAGEAGIQDGEENGSSDNLQPVETPADDSSEEGANAPEPLEDQLEEEAE